MNKATFTNFIKKYYIDGEIESVIIKSENNTSLVNFVSTNKDLVGNLTWGNSTIPDSEIAIFNTSKLLDLVNILSDDFTFNFEQNKGIFDRILLKDPSYKLSYKLSDKFMIPKVPIIQEPKNYDVTVDIDLKFINSFIKAKGALSEIDRFTIMTDYDDNNKQIVTILIGDKTSYSNKIEFETPASFVIPYSDPIPFPAKMFKNILNINKKAQKGNLYLSEEGLLKLIFEEDTQVSSYFMVRNQEN